MMYYNKSAFQGILGFPLIVLCFLFFMLGKSFNQNFYFETDQKPREDGDHLLPMSYD